MDPKGFLSNELHNKNLRFGGTLYDDDEKHGFENFTECFTSVLDASKTNRKELRETLRIR